MARVAARVIFIARASLLSSCNLFLVSLFFLARANRAISVSIMRCFLSLAACLSDGTYHREICEISPSLTLKWKTTHDLIPII